MTSQQPPRGTDRSPWRKCDAETHALKLSFDQLTLIDKSLLAAKSLGVLSQEDELVDDTLQLVDRALDAAMRTEGNAKD